MQEATARRLRAPYGELYAYLKEREPGEIADGFGATHHE
jgi:hypothetical protein